MANEIRSDNIIMNLTSQKNELLAEIEKTAKGITSLETDVKDVAKTSDKAFDEMSKSAKSYAEKLVDAQIKQKRVTQAIREQELSVKKMSKELETAQGWLKRMAQNTVAFQDMKKEANRLTEAIAGSNQQLRKLQIDKNISDSNVRDLQKMQKAANDAGKGLSNASGEISNLAQNSLRASGPLGNVTGILARLGPAGAIAAAGIAGLGAAFLNAKNTVQEFGDEVDVFLAGFEFKIRKIKDRLAVATVDLFRGEIRSAFENIDALIGLTPTGQIRKKILDAATKEQQKAIEQLKRDEFALQDFKIDNIEKLADLDREVQDKRLEFQEKLSEKGIKDLELAKSIEDDIKEIYRIKIKIQEEENRITLERNKLTISGRKEAEIEAENRAKIKELRAQESSELRTIAKLKRERPTKEKEQAVGILNVLRAQIAELQKAKNEALSIEDILQKEKLIFELEKTLKDMEETIKAFSERLGATTPGDLPLLETLIGRVSSPESTPNQIRAKIAALNKELGNTPQGTKRVKELNDEIERLQDLLNTGGLPAQPQLLPPKEGKDEVVKFLEEANEKVQIYGNMIRDLNDLDIQRKDRQIELQKERLQEFSRIAEQGNAEQLQLEEERLAKLIEAREKYAQRERAISALQIVAANAVSIAKGIQAVITGFATNPITGIANAVALAATVGSTILALRNSIGTIPAFEKGTEDTGNNGRGVDGKGGFPALLHPNERVLNKKQNRKIGKKSNDEVVRLVKLAEEYEANNRRIIGGNHRSDTSFNSSEITSKLDRTNRLLENLNIEANVNEFGLSAGISRANRINKRRQNLAR